MRARTPKKPWITGKQRYFSEMATGTDLPGDALNTVRLRDKKLHLALGHDIEGFADLACLVNIVAGGKNDLPGQSRQGG